MDKLKKVLSGQDNEDEEQGMLTQVCFVCVIPR